MPDRPSGSWIEDPKTGELLPNLDDPVMKARFAQPEEQKSVYRIPHIDKAVPDIRNTNDDIQQVKKGGKS